MWSAYKMARMGLISKCLPVLKDGDKFVRNPLIITDKYVEDGEIVYGEFKVGETAKEAKAYMGTLSTDFTLVDKEINRIIWTFANLFPRLPDEVHRRHPLEEEIFLGSVQDSQPVLADGQYDLRGLPGLRRLQYQEDHRTGRNRLHRDAPPDCTGRGD